ncbi:MAG: hypothetical protein FJ030_02755 [Chloroflexi bacterium]|nr:hypothetical protein [Chloroflexota bacterium]
MTFLIAWLWLFVTLAPLLALERWIHRHMQGIGLLLTRDPSLATILYSALFIPGVLLHELSHLIMAKALGVETARFSVWPSRQPDGTLRLGYVETAKVDFIREALIGIAPLAAGSAAVVLIGYRWLAVGPLGAAIAAGDLSAMAKGFIASLYSADSLIGLYALFTISNSMMPSASDRRAWLPVAIMLTLIGVALYYFGAAPLLVNSLGEPLAAGVRVIASAFTITIGVNLLIIPFIWLAEKLIARATGLKVNY